MDPRNGSDPLPADLNWPTENAKTLFSLIIPALRQLPVGLKWSLGGGTALAMRLGHRSSYDIDIFFTSSQGLKLLSPQRNSITKAISPRWQEPGHYLKFEVEHVGEIDILVTRDWIDPPTIVARVGEQSMKIQRPSEILVRKAAYRAPSFKIRDFFDLACVATMLPAEFAAAQPELTRHAADLADRWAAIAATADAALAAEVAPLPRGTNVA